MKIQTIVLLLATLSTGVLGGLFFTWSNTVTTGIGRLNDLEYLRAFQSMNRTILNPGFFLVFFGPALLLPLASYLYFKEIPNYLFWLLLAACLLYFVGVLVVTVVGNIPLNNVLENSTLSEMSMEDVKILRTNFESKWNSLNRIRTYSSIMAFLALILACVKTGS